LESFHSKWLSVREANSALSRQSEELEALNKELEHELRSQLKSLEDQSECLRSQLRELGCDLKSHMDSKAEEIVEKVISQIDFDIVDSNENIEEQFMKFYEELTGIKADVAEVKRSVRGQSRAIVAFGQHMLPVPFAIRIAEGNFYDEAEVIFRCLRTQKEQGFWLRAPRKWVKYAAAGANVIGATVMVSIGDLTSAVSGVKSLKKMLSKVQSLGEQLNGYKQGSIGVLSAADHDSMLNELKKKHFFEEWEFIEHGKEFGWCLRQRIVSRSTQDNCCCCKIC